MRADARYSTVDALRGIASFAVCWFHLMYGTPGFPAPGPLKASGAYGWMGVEVFFVISGFVIPLALYRARYELRHFGTFVLKRIVRLDPPYLASIALVLALQFASTLAPSYRGQDLTVSAPQLFLHLGYVNVFFGYPWLNPVYWTLALEVQYYLLIGLCFPLISSRESQVWIPALGTLALAPLVSRNGAFVFHYLPLFLLGIATFRLRERQLSLRSYALLVAALAVATVLALGRGVALVGLATALVIAFATVKPGLLTGLGRISYSLYLVHGPVGGRVTNFGKRYASTPLEELAVVLVGLAVSLVAAYIMYLLVERPAQQWASGARLKFGPRRAPEVGYVAP